LTHVHCRLVAPRLAEQVTVVATDLRGYGRQRQTARVGAQRLSLGITQPSDFPERLLAGKEEYYIRLTFDSQGLGKGGISEEA
jgi:hypothetical protein